MLDDEPPFELESRGEDYDVILNVKPEKVEQISSQIIDGKRCLVIPMDDHEHVAVNGVDAPL